MTNRDQANEQLDKALEGIADDTPRIPNGRDVVRKGGIVETDADASDVSRDSYGSLLEPGGLGSDEPTNIDPLTGAPILPHG